MQTTVDVTPTPRILRTLGDIPFDAWQCFAELALGYAIFMFKQEAENMAALITQLWDENQKQSEVLAQAKIDLEAIEILARVGNNTMIIEKTAKSAIDNVMKVGG